MTWSETLVAWHEFFFTTATISGALIGLTFIAISLRQEKLADDPHMATA